MKEIYGNVLTHKMDRIGYCEAYDLAKTHKPTIELKYKAKKKQKKNIEYA